MATKQKVEKKAYNAYADFITLCRLFFGSKPIDSVTSLDSDSVFYATAQDIVKEFEMNWDNLSPEDNNELMLTLLDEYYNKINICDDFDYILNVTVKEKKKSPKA